MIGTVFKEIKDYLNIFIPGTDPPVVIGDISQIDVAPLNGEVIMSLVNLEQDVPLRNNPNYTSISDTQVKYHNPRIHLNLYILFACHKGGIDGLNTLNEIIAAFQKRNVFLASDSDMNFPTAGGHLQTEKLIFDQYSMTFEQLNHLWGTLGGKYLPSVLYKVRLVSVFVDEDTEPANVITSIQREENVIHQ